MNKNFVTRLGVTAFALLAPGIVQAALTVTPVTWDVIGLDSNAPASGPRYFPVGARVCSNVATTNVSTTFVWDSANPYIGLRPGSLSTINIPALAAGACADAYFEAEVQQVNAAFDTARRYHITATDGSGSASTPTPRQLYVEHLVSQARNGVSDVRLDGLSIPPGGSMSLLLGNTYNITLSGATATQGYNQLESFINFSNTIFQILGVNTVYSADTSPTVTSPNDRLYADACGWDSNPASANYSSCVGSDGKAGGTVTTTYAVKIIGGGGTSTTLNSLIYDFSGSSFHYNGDYAVGARVAQIVSPVPPTFAKAFAPSRVLAGGTSVLTFTIGNANPTALANVAFVDLLPSSPAQLLIAGSPAATATGCGGGTLTATPGASSITLAGATVAANSTCTISVPVIAPAAPTSGAYSNLTGALSVNGASTGLTAAATLNVATAPTPVPGACTSPIDLVTWSMDAAQGLGVPPAYSQLHAQVASAAATFAAASGATNFIQTIGSPTANSWVGTGWQPSGSPPTANTASHFQFSADTSNVYGVGIRFNSNPIGPGDWANANNNVIHVFSQADSGSFSSIAAPATVKNTWTLVSAAAAATGTGTTTFRISAEGRGSGKPNAELGVDSVTITGCLLPNPPTITKAFAPSTIAVGGASTLTFTLTNPNASALSGVKFLDTLPAGVQVAPSVSAVTTCGGSPTWAPSAGDTALAFGQTTAATIPANSSCTVAVSVVATTIGAKLNISDFITAAESGANTTATGAAVATLNANPVVLPSVAAKSFAPATIAAGQTSILTATLYNTNATQTLTNVQLVDAYGGDLVNAIPLSPAVTNTCGGTLNAVAGDVGFSLTGVTLAPGASCSVGIPVTAATVGNKVNTTTAPQSVEGGPGSPASATLSVVAATPQLALAKRVSASATGPWVDYEVVSPADSLYYQFVVENKGNVPFASFSVSDPLLSGTGADPAGCAWQTTNSPTTLPGLPVASTTLDPMATCVRGPIAAASGTVVNTATATGAYNATSYTATDSATYLGAPPNLSLIKQIGTSASGPWSTTLNTAVGANVYYRFTIVNNSALNASGLSITDPLVSTASCSYVDPLTPGNASICVVGPVVAAGAPGATVVNTAFASGNGGTLTTPNAQASYTLPPDPADISLVKTLTTAGPFTVGQSISYTLLVANAGPDTATGIQVTDTPSNLTITNVSGGGCAALPCTIASLASGASVTINVTASIVAAGAFDNSATANANETDPNGANNTDNTGNGGTATAPVLIADLAVTKTNNAASVTSGSSTSYTVRVTNAGPDAVMGAILADPAVAGLTKTAVACSATPGACVTAPTVVQLEAGTFALPALALGGFFELVVTANVTAAAGGSVANTATVTVPAGTTDANVGNDTSTDFDPVVAAPVTAPPGAGDPGDMTKAIPTLDPLALAVLTMLLMLIAARRIRSPWTVPDDPEQRQRLQNASSNSRSWS